MVKVGSKLGELGVKYGELEAIISKFRPKLSGFGHKLCPLGDNLNNHGPKTIKQEPQLTMLGLNLGSLSYKVAMFRRHWSANWQVGAPSMPH